MLLLATQRVSSLSRRSGNDPRGLPAIVRAACARAPRGE
jgi:hypothetical protein